MRKEILESKDHFDLLQRLEELYRIRYPNHEDIEDAKFYKQEVLRLHFTVYFNKGQVEGRTHYYVGIRENHLSTEEVNARLATGTRFSWHGKSFVSQYLEAKRYAGLLMEVYDLFVHKSFL